MKKLLRYKQETKQSHFLPYPNPKGCEENKIAPFRVGVNNFILAVCLLFTLPAFAQQDPMYSQYLFNPAAINPAEAGKTETMNFFLISRHQWLTFDGGPSTQSIGVDLPLNGSKAGAGLVFISDRLGPTASNIFYMDYAYRLDITRDIKLDMGLRSGLTLFGANFTDLESHEQDDDLLMTDIKSKAMANFGFGASLYSKDFFASVSAPKLLKNKIDSEGNALSSSSQILKRSPRANNIDPLRRK